MHDAEADLLGHIAHLIGHHVQEGCHDTVVADGLPLRNHLTRRIQCENGLHVQEGPQEGLAPPDTPRGQQSLEGLHCKENAGPGTYTTQLGDDLVWSPTHLGHLGRLQDEEALEERCPQRIHEPDRQIARTRDGRLRGSKRPRQARAEDHTHHLLGILGGPLEPLQEPPGGG